MTTKTATGATPSRAVAGHGPTLGVWPAILMVALVLGAAVFAFSPRPPPAFPQTLTRADQLLIDGLAHRGPRWLAVGEQGHILLADGADVPGAWREAQVEPQRGSTFTQVLFVDDKLALAVGHDSWIVRSEDAGATWREVHFDGEQSEPLLGVAGPFDGRLFAFGGFGQMLVSDDLGKTWQPQVVETAEAADTAKPAAAQDDNPFATAATDAGTDRHLNAMTRLGNGTLLLVGEKGLLLSSRDNGRNWTALPAIYKGSFFGVLSLPSQAVLAFGMRGHAFISRDFCKTWQASGIPEPVSLFGGTVDDAGNVDLVGDGNTLLRSTDGGAQFSVVAATRRNDIGASGVIATVLPAGRGAVLTAGENGIDLRRLADTARADPGASR